jgi:hypothetical protein
MNLIALYADVQTYKIVNNFYAKQTEFPRKAKIDPNEQNVETESPVLIK